MPLISVITINLNDQNGLLRTIESVLNQNHASYEYIIIDGGSTDGSIEIIKRYQKEISYWISETDTGIYSAMNKGIKKATGEYCLFINSGDVLYNKNTLTDIVNQNLVADIISGSSFVKINREKAQLVKAPPTISFNTFFVHTILHQATLIRTVLFKKVGMYNENLKIVADWEFFVKAFFLHQSSYQQIDLTISVFDNNGISSKPENFRISLSEREDTLQKYFPYFIPDYNLLQPRSSYLFLENIQKNGILKIAFIFSSRLINKLFKILSI